MNELLCHAAFDAPLTASGEMMFMPAGAHTITPSQGGKKVTVNVMVTPLAAVELEKQRAALTAKGKRPYFDFNHDDEAASFWPTAFYWKDGAAPGIYCRGEWSDSGRAAVEGKEYRQFSPVFHVDNVRANPAQIVARELANPCAKPSVLGSVVCGWPGSKFWDNARLGRRPCRSSSDN